MKRYKNVLTGVALLGAIGVAAPALSAPTGISACQTIAVSGSYVLTGNLSATGDCLVIATDHVTIDFDGYSIVGNGSGSGVKSNGAMRKNIALRNGTIRNFVDGVMFFTDGIYFSIERMSLIENSNRGIAINGATIVKDSIFYGNGQIGLSVGSRHTHPRPAHARTPHAPRRNAYAYRRTHSLYPLPALFPLSLSALRPLRLGAQLFALSESKPRDAREIEVVDPQGRHAEFAGFLRDGVQRRRAARHRAQPAQR